MLEISVIICTYNRSNYLRQAIQSLAEQTLDRDSFEVIVVDNRSTDNTKDIVTKEFEHLSNLKYVYEPQQGLTYARNTGWKSAKTKYIAYLDDDAIASSGWLENILKAFAISPKIGCVGGKIVPLWEDLRPEWLPDSLLCYLAILDMSEDALLLTDGQYVFGANMSFDVAALQSVGGFDPELGRKGNNLLSNEELIVQKRLRIIGFECYYDSRVDIVHQIQSSRLTPDWFYQRAYWQGISNAVMRIKIEHSLFLRVALAINAWFNILKSFLEIPNLFANQLERVAPKCKVLQKLGYAMMLSGLVCLE
jgi:glycosyltransferase involved in cell wall biosynthesis